MTTTLRRTAAAILVLCIAPQLSAQEHNEQESLDRLRGIATSRIAEFRRQVRPLLDASEKAIEASIEYSVIATGSVNAHAVSAAGKRKIVVGAGILQVFEWLSVGNLMSRWGGRECGVAYSKHVLDGVVQNGVAPRVAPVFEPFTFASRRPSSCAGVTYAALRGDDAARKVQPMMLGASFRWLLAHELAHHLFNHRATSDAESRSDEEEADAFAFRVASADPASILLALPAYQVIAALGAEIEDESKSSHPAAAKRLRSFAGALKTLPDDDPDFEAYLDENGLREKWDDIVDQFLSDLTTALSK